MNERQNSAWPLQECISQFQTANLYFKEECLCQLRQASVQILSMLLNTYKKILIELKPVYSELFSS